MTQMITDLIEDAVRPAALAFSEWATSLSPAGVDGRAPNPVLHPAQAYKYLDGRRQTIIESSKLRPLIRIADKNLEYMTELDGEIDCSYEELIDDTGKLTITILYDNWLADWMINQTREIEDLHILIDPNPAKPNWRTRWGGKVTEIHLKQDEEGIHTIQLIALSHREHAKRILVAANPIFPPEIQLPRMWVMPGPCRTAVTTTMFVNLARLFMPIWSTVTNIFNPAAWFNPLGLDSALGFIPTEWPIQVAFVNPFLDQSRWTTVGATWTTFHDSFKDVLTDSGCVLRAYTYLTTDEDSPNGELADMLKVFPALVKQFTGTDLKDTDQTIDQICAPRRNCVVFSVEQKDGRTGPTGTIIDGIIATVAVTLDDLITPVTVNLDTGKVYDPGQVLNGMPIEEATGVERTYLFETLTGTAPDPPKVIWWEGDYSGAITTDLTFHKSSVKTIMTGGKSPTIVNQGITFSIKYALAKLSDVISWYATAGVQQQVPGTNGLDAIYQGQLDNTVLAWQRYTNPIRAIHAGDLSWQEHFEKGSGTAYVLASILTLRAGDWKTRPYASYKASVLNGHPWIAQVDYQLGDRVGFEKDGIIYVDSCFSIRTKWSRSEPLRVIVGIGDDKSKGDPFAAAFKTLAVMWNTVGMVAGQGTLFG